MISNFRAFYREVSRRYRRWPIRNWWEIAFYDQVWRDLNTYGFARTNSLRSVMGGTGLKVQRLSEFRNECIRFGEDPAALQSGVA